MIALSLDSRRSCDHSYDSEAALRRLGLERHTRADVSVANNFIRKALNGYCGKRLVDVSPVFMNVRHALGASLGWIMDNPRVSVPFRERMAEYVNRELVSFVEGRRDNGVIVMRRVNVAGEESLSPVGGHLPPQRIRSGSAILVPTGRTSPRLGDGEVYLRMDVSRPRFVGASFRASEFLFTDSDGKSIAGFGDITDYIENLDDVQLAIRNAVGGDVDDVGCNAAIFDAWWRYKIAGKTDDTILVPLPVADLCGNAITLVMKRKALRSWWVSLEIGGGPAELAEYLPETTMTVSYAEVEAELARLDSAFRRPICVEEAINIEHIFGDHADRFPAEFGEEIVADPGSAFVRLVDSLKNVLDAPDKWEPTMFYGGAEKDLVWNGDSVLTRVQYALPVFLTDEDVELERPSAYVIAGLKYDSVAGRDVCVFPTVLDNALLLRNQSAMRRAIRQSPRLAA